MRKNMRCLTVDVVQHNYMASCSYLVSESPKNNLLLVEVDALDHSNRGYEGTTLFSTVILKGGTVELDIWIASAVYPNQVSLEVDPKGIPTTLIQGTTPPSRPAAYF
jgi:hypothetical protein